MRHIACLFTAQISCIALGSFLLTIASWLMGGQPLVGIYSAIPILISIAVAIYVYIVLNRYLRDGRSKKEYQAHGND